MPIFRCLMRGENFPGALLGKSGPLGFYATRFVDAESPKAAELAALELLRTDPSLAVPPEARTTDAKVFFEAIEALEPAHERESGRGFTFFPMET
ncbi:MAG TPA: hypothetical protein VLF18_05750 [Tahibacter sp.]|uniref:hypothetical protein n=1 Tax=Tahibacter sp. TaxID=2056211 RepID=UPI002C3002F1|nr:hypothetical protein [Tahibacter sp.]HSX59683.1 hypothetical protein [Tahibacter sp.]